MQSLHIFPIVHDQAQTKFRVRYEEFGGHLLRAIGFITLIIDRPFLLLKVFKPALVVNNLHGIMRAGEAGIGIVGIPDYMTVLSRRLVRVLPTVRGEEFDLYFVYPTELRGSVRAKVFREFLTHVTKNWPKS